MKKTREETEERKKLKEKKQKLDERKEKGHYAPKFEVDRAEENKLKTVAMKGGIVLFEIFDF